MTIAARPQPAPETEEVHEAIAGLGRLVEVFTHRRRQLAQVAGLTEREWAVLEEISSEHFMPSMFARRQESSPAAVSKILRQLLDKSLISVTVSKDDGRQRRYVLTARGRRAIERLRAARQQAIEQVWMRFGADEIRELNRLTTELTERLEAYAATVGSKG